MKIAKILKKKFKTLSLTLATLLTCSMVAPSIPTSASVGGTVEIGGLSAEQWNSMTEGQREEYFNNLRATGNTGAGVMVGGWTNGAGPLMVPPITMDGDIAYCLQAMADFPVGTYYANPSVSTDTKIRSVAFHGYPNNGSGLQQKHGLTDTQARQYTQVAVWKVMGQVGPGLAIADRTHPYVDELVSLANRGDIGAYTNMEFNLSSTTLEAHRLDGYQETDVVGTSGTPGTFTFPSNGDIWSVDVNGNAKNVFNIGESFKVRSTSNFDGLKDLTISAKLGNPSALVFDGTNGHQDILQFSWGDPVASNVNMRVKFTALGTINLHKTNDKGANLQGVKFGLYSDKDAANLLMESTTDANGNITFSDLKEGTYYVKELATLEGHILSNEIKEVNVVAGGTNSFEWVNDTIKSVVKFFKYDEDTKQPMPNVEFKIEALTGLDKGQVFNVKTDETGYFTKELSYGKYQITEVKTNDGYVINTQPIPFEVNQNGQTIELSMSNKRIKSTVKFLKLDSETGLPMANVKFLIKAIDGLEAGKEWNVVTDETGYFTAELPYGNYEIVEVETLEGYILNTSPIPFTVDEDGQTIELSMNNDRVKGAAELLKVDAETNQPLANVEFELECLEGFNQGEKITLTSDENGLVKMDSLQYGKYRVTEIKTLDGYVLDSTPMEFEIRTNGDTVKLEMVNRKIKGRLEIIKIDGKTNKKLQGAEFGIYDENKNLIETIVTDENGSAVSSDLLVGKYYYREIKSPEGYEIDGNFYEFNIEKDNIVEVVRFKNFPTITYENEIVIEKWDNTNKPELPYTGGTNSMLILALGLGLCGAGVKLGKKKNNK